jgi:RimJ/RimL family protein N-acetyltransferase
MSVPPTGTPVEARYSSDDLTMYSLSKLGLNAPQAILAQQWILSMTVATDGEEGKEFWQWIAANNQNAGTGSIYDTFLFIDNTSQMVVATASIVPDDRMVGSKHNIDGVWLGGINVCQQFRGHGIGAQILPLVDAHVQAWTRDQNQNVQVNLFTDNPIAMSMYSRAGYLRLGVFAVDNTRRQPFLTRPSQPALGTKVKYSASSMRSTRER